MKKSFRIVSCGVSSWLDVGSVLWVVHFGDAWDIVVSAFVVRS